SDDYGFLHATQTLAHAYMFQDNYEKSRALLDEVLPVYERVQFGESRAFRWEALAIMHYYNGEYAGCQDLAARGIAAARTIGEPNSEALCTAWLALVDAETG